MMADIFLIIPAAGVGQRFGAETPKQYQLLLNKTILQHTLERFCYRQDIKQIVLVVAKNDCWIQQLQLPSNVVLVVGGKERVDSVKAAMVYLAEQVKAGDLVAVHDAARPCVRSTLLDELFTVARKAGDGVLPVLMVKETVKKVVNEKIVATLDRSEIALAQTPQVFPFALLNKALKQTDFVTDDASAVEALGFLPHVIEGDPDNIKITLAQDMKVAELALQSILAEES